MSKNYLAAIHIAEKALGLSREDATALKMSLFSVPSAAMMTVQQHKRYLAHLSGLQAKQAIARGEKPAYTPAPRAARAAHQAAPADEQDERWFKARALWHTLAAAGAVRADTDAALAAYVKRQTKMDAWRFLNSYQLNSVIESLKKWCTRSGVVV